MAVDTHGLEAIRKCANEIVEGDPSDLYLNTRGKISTVGLSTAGLVTEVTLNDSTWTELPATALSGRNAISIQNRSGDEIKINYNNAQAGYVGIVIPDGGERFYDITDDIIIYGKAESGATPTINVEELS